MKKSPQVLRAIYLRQKRNHVMEELRAVEGSQPQKPSSRKTQKKPAKPMKPNKSAIKSVEKKPVKEKTIKENICGKCKREFKALSGLLSHIRSDTCGRKKPSTKKDSEEVKEEGGNS